MGQTIQFKRGTTDRWDVKKDTILKAGEPGYDVAKHKLKIGDGINAWSELPYVDDAHIFGVIIEKGEDHIAALTAAVGTTELNIHDIGIVKELIVADKYLYTSYLYDGEKWIAMDGNYNASNVYFDTDMDVTIDVGYIKTTNGVGTIPSTGKNLIGVFEAMYNKELDPEKTDPSVSVTLTGAGSYEVGTVVTDIKYTASFEDGKYSYGPEPTGVEVIDWTITDTNNEFYSTPSSDLPDVTVTDTTKFNVAVKVTYTAGSVPLTNKGNPCKLLTKKIAAGSKSKTSSSITGYRSFFYGVLATSSTEAPLTSAIIREQLINGGAYDEPKSLTLTGKDIENAKRFVIVIPSNSSRSGLKEVILTSAMNTPITDSYDKTSAAVRVEGVNGADAVNYDVWVYEPASIDAGEIHAIELA